MLEDPLIFDLDCVELSQKNLLPHYSGIYYVVDREKTIWYIGRSFNLNKRWNGEKPHHRYSQLLSLSAKQQKSFLIYYHQIEQKELIQKERKFIIKYQPLLNNTKIIKANIQKNSSKKRLLNNLQTYNSLKILSDFTKIENNEIKYKSKIHNKDLLSMINNTQADKVVALSVKQFERKFIRLSDEKIKLDLEIEICIDQQKRLFVRHHVFTYICDRGLEIIDENKDNEQRDKLIKNVLGDIHSRLKYLHNPLRWIGYKLNCEDIVLIDEEDQLEIETLAIMLPFRMFVNLIEDAWMKNSNLSNYLKNQEDIWFQQVNLITKIAKYLDNKNLTLIKLVEELAS